MHFGIRQCMFKPKLLTVHTFLKSNLEFIRVVILVFVVCKLCSVPIRVASDPTVYIPDPNLRAALELALGKDVGADIAQADMASLKELVAFKTGIRDLTGLEFATNLTDLRFGANRISDVSPLKELTHLTKLHLGSNRNILDVSPLKNLTNLTYLEIDSNQILDVSPLKNMTNLTWLDLDDNRISNVSPLKGLKNLEYLDLDGNQISDVSPLKELKNLIFLDIDDNEISDISPLSALTNLTVLDLEGNQISDVSALSALTNLTELDIHNNEISDISPLSALTNLTVLDLEGNQISDFSPIAGLIRNLVEYNDRNQTVPSIRAADVNRDGVVNILDLILVASNYNAADLAALGRKGIYPDVNSDGVVDITDLVAIAAEIDSAAAPTLISSPLEAANLTAANLKRWIDLANQFAPLDPQTLRGIAVLEQLLAALKQLEVLPKETALLANYPNPFNPETWIPYQLAQPADVTVTIYAMDGNVLRTLALGYQSIGIYQGKSRAAYWNGKNALGEPVASGVYFYTLTAGEFTATRKMLIRK